MDAVLFNVTTPLHFNVHTTAEYWNRVCVKHPEITDLLSEVIETLQNPIEIRQSKRDNFIFLFYSEIKKYWLCVVVKQTGFDGFPVTEHIPDRIKEGDKIWPK